MSGYRMLAPSTGDAELLTTGEEAIARGAVGPGEYPLDSGKLFFTIFTARKTEPITQVRTGVYGTASGGLTVARVGIWSVAAGGDLTPVTASDNDTGLWNSTFSNHTATLADTWNKVAGVRWAFGLLAVGDDMPVLGAQGVKYLDGSDPPVLQAELGGQTDFPEGVIAAGSLSAGYRRYQAIFLP